MGRVRIGLTQRSDPVPGRDERRDALDARWPALIEGAGYVPVPVPNVLGDPEAFIVELGLTVLILTGGNDLGTAPERDATESRLLGAAERRGLPVLGVCRGLQMMVASRGGALQRVEGHVARPHTIELVADTEWPMRDQRVVNSFHEWAVTPDALGSDLVALARAPDGTVEAVQRRGVPHVGVMWHPEREPQDADDLALIHALAGAG